MLLLSANADPLSTVKSGYNGHVCARTEWKKVAWSNDHVFLLHQHPGACPSFTWAAGGWQRDALREAGKPAGGSVMLWGMFCWETLGPGILVEVTLTCTTYPNAVADQVHPFMTTVFPDGGELSQQDDVPCHTAKIVQEWN